MNGCRGQEQHMCSYRPQQPRELMDHCFRISEVMSFVDDDKVESWLVFGCAFEQARQLEACAPSPRLGIGPAAGWPKAGHRTNHGEVPIAPLFVVKQLQQLGRR